MSFFRFTHTAERDDFWSGQAIMETKFSVGNMKAARESKVNQTKKPIGSITANAENVGIQVNFLVVMDKSETVHTGYTPPIVYDSLTGYGYTPGQSKWDLMSKLSLVGRAQSSVNYQGTVPEQKDISVQVGGLAAVRLFMSNSKTILAWGDRLIWTVPDIGNTDKAAATYRHLNSLARAEFPKGKVPILVKKMTERHYAEFPMAALRHFCEKSTAKRDYWKSKDLENSKDPLDRYILTNFVGPYKTAHLFTQLALNKTAEEALKSLEALEDWEPFNAILIGNLGLLPGAYAKEKLQRLGGAKGVQFVQALEGSAELRNALQKQSTHQMAGQFDCFSHLRDRNFGKAMSVGRSGDGVKVLFRIT